MRTPTLPAARIGLTMRSPRPPRISDPRVRLEEIVGAGERGSPQSVNKASKKKVTKRSQFLIGKDCGGYRRRT